MIDGYLSNVSREVEEVTGKKRFYRFTATFDTKKLS